jgi:hypothetical protein
MDNYLAAKKLLTPFDRLVYWIRERESIRLKKEAGQPKPWTEDPLLREYRYCNVRRMDDRVSQWLLNNWYKPNFGHPRMLGACALARHFNLPEALCEITKFVFGRWDPPKIKATIRGLKAKGKTVFNGAYMVRGIGEIDKTEMVVARVVQPLIDNPPKLNTDSMQQCVESLLPYWGFSDFMSGQVIADYRWAVAGNWKDRNSWAPIGPGSLKGMNYLMGRRATQPLTQGQFIIELKEVRSKLVSKLPRSITNRLEMMDYQNVMCEYRAYHQAIEGIKLPKRRYK